MILDEQVRLLRFAGAAEVGINTIRGPNLFDGHLAAEHNQGLWNDIDGSRWMNTGDLCRQDADGYLWLAGRKKELMIRGGHNIDPKLIEDALSRHPAVALVAAVGKPDPAVGEVPVAHERDARHGAHARVSLSGDPEPLRNHLERYTFRCTYANDTGHPIS